MEKRKDEYEKNLKVLTGEISKLLNEAGIQHDVKGRSKHLYSIYRKMMVQQKKIDEIFDILAVRILVSSVKDCYAALGSLSPEGSRITSPCRSLICISRYIPRC